jgi:hypothetical protein
LKSNPGVPVPDNSGNHNIASTFEDQQFTQSKHGKSVPHRSEDNLFIDETHFSSHHDPVYDHPLYRQESPTQRAQRHLQSKISMREKLEKYRHHTGEVVGFYHIYADANQNYKHIVNEQMAHIEKSGLIDKVDTIFYNTIHIDHNISHPKYIHLSHLGEIGEESQTVSALYEYCHHHPKAKVFYFHDKGSFHATRVNEVFRHNLNCYVLTPHCIPALDEHDTCGMRASPTPFIHYSGNFWWAKCNYVNTLIDPLSPQNNETFRQVTSRLSNCIGVEARYFIETWIGSAPQIKPADCLPVEADKSYLYGYFFPPSLGQHCPYLDANSPANSAVGLPCDTAAAWKHAEDFQDAYDHIREIEAKECALTNLPAQVTKRSYFWYGQEPTMYLEWMKRIVRMRNISDGTAIRGAREVQCYYYKDGEIHAIPSANALFKLGKGFEDIVVLPTYQIPLFKRGADVSN